MQYNPYQPPQSDISPGPTSTPLASRRRRFAAAVIDNLVMIPIYLILYWLFYRDAQWTDEGPGDRVRELLINALALVAIIAVNWKFLCKGQSIGKMMLKLQIQCRHAGTVMPVRRIVTHRMLPIDVVMLVSSLHSVVEIVAPLLFVIDALCIFRPSKSTIHDDIAGSKVVFLKD